MDESGGNKEWNKSFTSLSIIQKERAKKEANRIVSQPSISPIPTIILANGNNANANGNSSNANNRIGRSINNDMNLNDANSILMKYLWTSSKFKLVIANSIIPICSLIWTPYFLLLPHLPEIPDTDTDAASFLSAESMGHYHSDINNSWKFKILNFLRVICHQERITSTALILSFILIHRLRSKNPGQIGGTGAEARLFTIGLCLAHKSTEDTPFINDFWVTSVGSSFTRDEINKMEREFLHAIDHRTFIGKEEFHLWVNQLNKLYGWTRTFSRLYHTDGRKRAASSHASESSGNNTNNATPSNNLAVITSL